MTSPQAVADGIRRVARAPMVMACVFGVTALTAVPFALLMRASIASHLGSSLAADRAAAGINAQWMAEFQAQAGDLGQTLRTTIVGFAAVLDNLSALLDGEGRAPVVLWIGAAYLLLWLFLSGGILNRYARNRPTRSYEFFAACGLYFVRFLRLAPIVAATYYVMLAVVHPFLLGAVYRRLIQDVTVERTAFFYRLALYALFGAMLVLANLVFDYAKVRAVVEDRRSMIGAVAASARFVRRNFPAVLGTYLMNGLLFVAVLLAYALAAPGAGGSGAGLWAGLAVSHAYLLARLWVKLVFLASETALFQGRLAHAGYVAGAAPPRPEPPIVEQVLQRAP